MSNIPQHESQHPLFDIPTLFTHVFILVDDWCEQHPRHSVGRKPLFSDSEVLTLLLMMDFLPYPSERQYLAYVRANHFDLFPACLTRASSTSALELCVTASNSCGRTCIRSWLKRYRLTC